ncbi:MAG: hypothetical protein JWR80_2993 [Bradyrhizobium sp.]|nr:hypothetical protein [Bradyrhizobium sp.]
MSNQDSHEKRAGLQELLSFYYPMHYRIGMDLETTMGQRRISRKQVAILWLIHSRAGADGWLKRKAVEDRLASWFEASNSTISNLLRDLARPSLALVEQIENPESGREKLVRLTDKGEEFVAGMIEASVQYLSQHLTHLGDEQLKWGLQFFNLAFRPLKAMADGGELPPPPWATDPATS